MGPLCWWRLSKTWDSGGEGRAPARVYSPSRGVMGLARGDDFAASGFGEDPELIANELSNTISSKVLYAFKT